MTNIVTFQIENKRLALDVDVVERIIWAVEITKLPGASNTVLGVINVQGKLTCVLNMRKLLNLNEKRTHIDDRIVICKFIPDYQLAFLVDKVNGVVCYNEGDSLAIEGDENNSLTRKVVKVADELHLVLDPDHLAHCLNAENLLAKLL